MKRIALLSAVLAALSVTARASAQDPVELLYAKAASSTSIGEYATGYVEVQNIAYAKTVTIHYRIGDSSTWTDVSASYVAPTHDSFEAWKFSTGGTFLTSPASSTIEFAIKYVVSGSTYWDNNGGNNYKIGIGTSPSNPRVIFGTAKVALDYASAGYSGSAQALSGQVIVKNLAYTKTVNIVYSTDSWVTVQRAAASWSSSLNSDLDLFAFNFTLPSGTTSVVFAVEYIVSGTTYWDNNFGSNYSATW